MILAIASGKGGTGKTTIAVNLAASLDGPVTYADCDVEAPNGHLFLRPEISQTSIVGIPVPEIDAAKCTGCGACAELCQYHALACIRGKVLVFSELCHGCGGCTLVCPEGAIREQDRGIGVVESGVSNGIHIVQGRLRIGEGMAPPLIRGVKERLPRGIVLLDSPPGTSCPMITAVRGADYVVLVTEPTPFGLHDLTLAVETVRQLGIPFGVIINRCDAGDGRVTRYCLKENIPVLLHIKEDRRIAEAYARGELAVNAVPELRRVFRRLFADIRQQLQESAAC